MADRQKMGLDDFTAHRNFTVSRCLFYRGCESGNVEQRVCTTPLLRADPASAHLQQSYQQDNCHNNSYRCSYNTIDKHTAATWHTDSAVGATLHACRHRNTTLRTYHHRLIIRIDIVWGCILFAHNSHLRCLYSQR